MKKKTKKNFSYIWDIIELPVLIIAIYSILDFLIPINDFIDKIIPVKTFSMILTVGAFAYIGYLAVKKNEEVNYIAKLGAYAGAIIGLFGAVIGLITYYFFPDRIAEAIEQARSAGADMAVVQTMIKIGIYANFIISPLINALLGALISWLSGLLFWRLKK